MQCPIGASYDEKTKQCVCQTPLYNYHGECIKCPDSDRLNRDGTGCEPICQSCKPLTFSELPAHEQWFEALGYATAAASAIYYTWLAIDWIANPKSRESTFETVRNVRDSFGEARGYASNLYSKSRDHLRSGFERPRRPQRGSINYRGVESTTNPMYKSSSGVVDWGSTTPNPAELTP